MTRLEKQKDINKLLVVTDRCHIFYCCFCWVRFCYISVVLARCEMTPVDRDLLGLAQNFQQDNRALFAIVYLEDGLQPVQGAVHNGNGSTGFEEVLFGME